MALSLTRLSDLATAGFDTVIDVRAPAEYALDHLPGAINLPVLSDAERARVGTIYKQVDPFIARKVGAALVARNAAAHLEGPLAGMPGGWRPLVYCWRGGQRSGSFASILAQVGWRVETLSGGYKAWRRLVVEACYDTPLAAPVIVLDGDTGTAKTAVLERLAARGAQVIDLEGLANHRGSLFGALGPQPSQTSFEGALAMRLVTLDPARPLVVEAESAAIGNVNLPPRLWRAMVAAPRIVIRAPLAERAAFLTRAYADLVADPARLLTRIEALRPMHAREVIAEWQAQAAGGDLRGLAEGLMARHYDPRYASHRARMPAPAAEVAADRLDEAGIDTLADRVAAAIAQISRT
jgi:tRNA 2-selenouridine synthase